MVTRTKRTKKRERPSYRYDLMSLRDHEKNIVRETMDRFDGNVAECARALGLAKSTMYEKLYYHGLKKRVVR